MICYFAGSESYDRIRSGYFKEEGLEATVDVRLVPRILLGSCPRLGWDHVHSYAGEDFVLLGINC
jgi:hypothetical protein